MQYLVDQMDILGDYESAVNTLNTAISLISQSAAASSESSQVRYSTFSCDATSLMFL